jgi:cell division protein FtsZ
MNRREFLKFVSLGSISLIAGKFTYKAARLFAQESLSPTNVKPKIKVIGIGGAGCSFVDKMIKMDMKGIDFIAASTDISDLEGSLCYSKILLGESLCHGYGCGSQPEVGYDSAYESKDIIGRCVKGSDVVMILSGMGGGTGTGGSIAVAQICKESNAYTIGSVTMPFWFEGKRRCSAAQAGIHRLKEISDMTVLIPLDSVSYLMPPSKGKVIKIFHRSAEIQCFVVKTFHNILLSSKTPSTEATDIKNALYRNDSSQMRIGDNAKHCLMLL